MIYSNLDYILYNYYIFLDGIECTKSFLSKLQSMKIAKCCLKEDSNVYLNTEANHPLRGYGVPFTYIHVSIKDNDDFRKDYFKINKL